MRVESPHCSAATASSHETVCLLKLNPLLYTSSTLLSHSTQAVSIGAGAVNAVDQMAAIMPRDVDKLDPVPDSLVMSQDQQYLAKHSLDKLFETLLLEVLKEKPADPLQYIIDSLSLGPEHAAQDPETGLPQHRKEKLLRVFTIIDKDGSGKISLRMLQTYASKHGGETLTLEDLKGLFQDFKPSNENFINQQEFLVFFSKVSRTISNKEFDEMIKEMQG